jgi:hypothetical protein
MTRRNDLVRLRDAVGRGDLHEMPYRGMPMATACYRKDDRGRIIEKQAWKDNLVIAAYHGDLGAASEMFGNVLPGWGCVLNTYRQWVRIWDQSSDDCPEHEAVNCHSVARAWLLAILEALIAQEPDPAPMMQEAKP